MKTYLGHILLFCLAFILLFCNEDHPTIIDISVDMWIRDQSGNNLLNAATAGYYKKEDIRIFYLQDGVRKEFNNPRMDAPRGFIIYRNDGNGEYVMKLSPYEGIVDKEITTTYIQWNDTQTDTVRCLMSRIYQSIYCKKIWYNNVLKYDDAVPSDITWGNSTYHRFIEIDK